MSKRDKSWWEKWLFIRWYKERTRGDAAEAGVLMRRKAALQRGELHVETLEAVYGSRLEKEEEEEE